MALRFFQRPHAVNLLIFPTVVALLVASSSLSEEIVVQNDSLQDGSDGAIQVGFVAGESAAAWLTSPCAGRIVAVQVFWMSLLGGEPPSLEDSITIFESGAFPVPGAQLEFLEGPVMTDGVMNEFRYVDESQKDPIDIPVSNGQVFVVSFKFAITPPPLGPSVVTDINGCQNGKNGIFAIPPSAWFNACDLGVTGDFVIRAVVDCGDPEGACCLDSGDCVDGITAGECVGQGGDYQGDGTDCGSTVCRQACCLPNGNCADVTVGFCNLNGGDPQGAGSECANTNCPLVGACCLDSGDCVDGITEAACITQGGAYEGDNTDCSQITCRQACCLEDDCADVTVDFCESTGGVPQGAGTDCASVNCFPMGACCLPDGNCANNLSPEDCEAQGGAFQGDGVTCGEVECPQPSGACCVGESCKVLTRSVCDLFPNSTWAGPGTDCEDLDGNGVADDCEGCHDPPEDADGDCDVDLLDYGAFWGCKTGPFGEIIDPACECFDGDKDGNIDLIDWGFFQVAFTGEGPGCPP